MKLYVLAGACSMVPHTALEWSKTDYEFEIVGRDKIKSPEYLKLNPQGAVPLLVDGDFVLSQNVAILNYLDQCFPQANIFGTGNAQARAKVWHWLAYANSDVHKTFSPMFSARNFVTEESSQQDLIENSRQKIIAQMAYPDSVLGQQDFLTGEITIADIYMYVLLRWARGLKIDLSEYKNLAPFFARIEGTAAVQSVIKQEGIRLLA